MAKDWMICRDPGTSTRFQSICSGLQGCLLLLTPKHDGGKGKFYKQMNQPDTKNIHFKNDKGPKET